MEHKGGFFHTALPAGLLRYENMRSKEIRSLKAELIDEYPVLGLPFAPSTQSGAGEGTLAASLKALGMSDDGASTSTLLDALFDAADIVASQSGDISVISRKDEGGLVPLFFGVRQHDKPGKVAGKPEAKGAKSGKTGADSRVKTADDGRVGLVAGTKGGKTVDAGRAASGAGIKAGKSDVRLFPTIFCLWQLQTLTANITTATSNITTADTTRAADEEEAFPQLGLLPLPVLWVAPGVSAAVLRGADIMTPGVLHITNSSDITHIAHSAHTTPVIASDYGYEEGAAVAVCVVGNPAPFAVASLSRKLSSPLLFSPPLSSPPLSSPLLPSPAFREERTGEGSAKGTAASILQRYADALWQRVREAGYLTGALVVPNAGFRQREVVPLAGDHSSEKEDDLDASTQRDETPPPVDDAIQLSLLQVCKKHLKDKQLPILASALPTMMQAAKQEGWDVDLRHSKWKKLGALLKDIASGADPLLFIKDVAGVLSIVGINRDNAQLVAFRPWATYKETGKPDIEDEDEEAGRISYTPPLLLELSMPPPCFRPLLREAWKAVECTAPRPTFAVCFNFSELKAGRQETIAPLLRHAAGIKTLKAAFDRCPWVTDAVGGDSCVAKTTEPDDAVYFLQDLRQLVNTYVTRKALTFPKDKACIVLDEVLADALAGKLHVDTHAEETAESVIAEEADEDCVILRDDLNRSLEARLGKIYVLVFALTTVAAHDDASLEIQVFRDAPPQIAIEVRAIQGGKRHVTLVGGLEAVKINPSFFARDISRKCAAAASCTSAEEARFTLPLNVKSDVIVQIQGDVAALVESTLLESPKTGGFGLPPACVTRAAAPAVGKGKGKR